MNCNAPGLIAFTEQHRTEARLANSGCIFQTTVKIGFKLPADEFMTLRISDAAASCWQRRRARGLTAPRYRLLADNQGITMPSRPSTHGGSTSCGVASLLLCRRFCRAVSLPPPRLGQGIVSTRE